MLGGRGPVYVWGEVPRGAGAGAGAEEEEGVSAERGGVAEVRVERAGVGRGEVGGGRVPD